MEKLRTGLKKGDYFEDGGRFFVVDDVLENGNYISHRVSVEEATEKKVETKAPAKTEKKSGKKAKQPELPKVEDEDSNNNTSDVDETKAEGETETVSAEEATEKKVEENTSDEE